ARLRRGERRLRRAAAAHRWWHDSAACPAGPAPARAGRVVTRILVVDDEPQFLRALETNLRGAGYEVDTATTAQEALTAAGLRRDGPPGDPVLEVGPIRIDLDKQSVAVDGRVVHLTPHEYRILRLLALNPGKLLTHRAILQDVWGPGYGAESNYLHVYVSQLRRKLEPDPSRPQYIVTEPGAGYRLIES